jgi:hypothetical protein
MAFITYPQAVALVLAYLGGTKVAGVHITVIEGSAAVHKVSGVLGALSGLTGPIAGLLNDVVSGGLAAVMENPVGGVLNTLSSTLSGSTITSGLSALVTAGKITSGDFTNITNALTGSSGLLAAATSLTGHTDALSGIVTSPNGTTPDFNSVVSLASSLDGMAGGQFGSAAAVLPTVISGLSSGSDVGAATTYVNGIVAALGAGTTTPAAVISGIGTHSATLNGYVANDTTNFTAASTNIGTAGQLTDLVAAAKNPSTAVQALMTQVVPPANLSILANA